MKRILKYTLIILVVFLIVSFVGYWLLRTKSLAHAREVDRCQGVAYKVAPLPLEYADSGKKVSVVRAPLMLNQLLSGEYPEYEKAYKNCMASSEIVATYNNAFYTFLGKGMSPWVYAPWIILDRRFNFFGDPCIRGCL